MGGRNKTCLGAEREGKNEVPWRCLCRRGGSGFHSQCFVTRRGGRGVGGGFTLKSSHAKRWGVKELNLEEQQ